jgi:uncharacterized protein (DUF1810 family)
VRENDGVEDEFRLERFVSAQNGEYGSYPTALAEVRAGRKAGHWMWYVFPQVVGLGFSSMSQEYGISGLDEARAFLRHPVLGPRLIEITSAVVEAGGRTASGIFGYDDVKLRSSMTLFSLAAPEVPVFQRVLDTHFSGERDPATVARLRGPAVRT